jgi:hypothetical protein
MATAVMRGLICPLAFICVFDPAHAQAPLDPALIDMAARMEPGQSIVRGASTLTLNQRDAGAKDAEGWFLAKSDRGGFSVRLPGPINDETFVTKTDAGARIEVNMLITRTSSMSYMVNCVRQSERAVSIDNVKQYVAAIGAFSKDFKSQPFASGAVSGFEYSGVDPTGTYFAGRMFPLDNQLCQFLIGSHTRFDGITPDIRVAFESFQSLKKDPG